MNLSDLQTLQLRRDGKVLVATMNRPDTLNAVDPQMHQELERLFNGVAADSETNVLVFTGAGRAFSAGGDIEQMQRLIDDPELFY